MSEGEGGREGGREGKEGGRERGDNKIMINKQTLLTIIRWSRAAKIKESNKDTPVLEINLTYKHTSNQLVEKYT